MRTNLDGREREIMQLEVLDGYTSNEIAARIKISPGAVRMTRSRAVGRLREIMTSHANDLAGSPVVDRPIDVDDLRPYGKAHDDS